MTPERKMEYAEKILMAIGAHYVLFPQPNAPSGMTTCDRVVTILDEALSEHGEELLTQALRKEHQESNGH